MQQAITLTNSTLLKYTMFSLVFAAITLLTIILPAEYDIDPTGIGHKLGLTVFNNVLMVGIGKTLLIHQSLFNL